MLINQIAAIESQPYVDINTLHNGKPVRTIQVGLGENLSLVCIVKPNNHTVLWQTKNKQTELPTKWIANLNLFTIRKSDTYTCESPSAELKRSVHVIAKKRIRRSSDHLRPLSSGDYLDDLSRKQADALKELKDQLDLALHPKPERNDGVIYTSFKSTLDKMDKMLNLSAYDMDHNWKFDTKSKSNDGRKFDDALKEIGSKYPDTGWVFNPSYGSESNNKPEPETKNDWNFNTNSRDHVERKQENYDLNWNKPEKNDWIDTSKIEEKNDWNLYDTIPTDQNDSNYNRSAGKKKWTRNIVIIVGSVLAVGFAIIIMYVAITRYRSSKTEQPTNTTLPQTTVRVPELQPLNTENIQPGRPIETYITPYPPERSSSLIPSPSAPIDDYQFSAGATRFSELPPPSYDEAVYNAKVL